MVLESFLIFGSIISALMAPSMVIAVLMRNVSKALGRNPAAVTNIFMWMIGMLILVEVISITAIVITFQLFSTGR